MSDGPHKSLPLRRHWRDLAERAAKAAFSAEEVCEALPVALKRDFLSEARLLNTIQEIFVSPQATLFTDDRIAQLEAARQISRGSVAGLVLIDCAIEAVSNGLTGEAAYTAAIRNALSDHTLGTFRSMEEHYLREGSERSARFLRGRLDAARGQGNFETIAQEIASHERPTISSVQIRKRDGLDEGPPL